MRSNNILLVGFMGTGKSVVGRELARKLEFDFLDTDDLIIERAGKPIPAIFAEDGEPHFRQLEEEVIATLVQLKDHIIATGGGVVMSDRNWENMYRVGLVICLTASPQVIYQRTRHNTDRPLLEVPDPLKQIKDMLVTRQPFYERADFTINTSQLTVAQVTERILKLYQHFHKHRSQNQPS